MKLLNTLLGHFVDRGEIDIQTGPFGTQLRASDYTPDGTPVINVRNIGYGTLRPEKLEYVPESVVDRLSRHILVTKDIVFGRKGAVDRHLLVDELVSGWMQGSDCIRIRLKSKSLLPEYLSRALCLENHKRWILKQCSNKATMASLNQDVICRIPIYVPDPRTQREIVRILSAYDDLIENNRRRIELLEQSARLLYKEWFVHLRFPGHEHTKITDGVPEGWEKKTLGTIAPLKYGKALKKDNRIPGAFPVYGSSGIVGAHQKALVPGPSIIVGRKGNVGSIYFSNEDMWPIDTVYYIGSEVCSLFLYYALCHVTFINTDVAVPGLNRDYAHSREIIIPDSVILSLFHEHVIEVHSQLDTLKSLNQSLTSARDLLLPRLMNGEISV